MLIFTCPEAGPGGELISNVSLARPGHPGWSPTIYHTNLLTCTYQYSYVLIQGVFLTLLGPAYLSVDQGWGGVRVPILYGNDFLWNDLPYSKGFMEFGCLEH